MHVSTDRVRIPGLQMFPPLAALQLCSWPHVCSGPFPGSLPPFQTGFWSGSPAQPGSVARSRPVIQTWSGLRRPSSPPDVHGRSWPRCSVLSVPALQTRSCGGSGIGLQVSGSLLEFQSWFWRSGCSLFPPPSGQRSLPPVLGCVTDSDPLAEPSEDAREQLLAG